MKIHSARLAATIFVVIALGGAAFSFQKDTPSGSIPVSMVVSVEARHGKDVPTVYREDVRVFHNHERLQVTGWVPLQGEQAGLELFMLIDDSSDTSVGGQFDDLKKFITSQPATTSIAVGYIRNGTVFKTQNFTDNHALAAKALRLPLGSGGAIESPYVSITELIDHWPESPNRRTIFMVSSGMDALQPGSTNTYLDQAISRAQQAGVQIYSIYASPTGHFGHSSWRTTWGQNNLSQITDETGGEAYFQGRDMPISFSPFLEQFASRLKHQYRLTFLARADRERKSQHIQLETEVPNAELVAADRVHVPATK